MADTRPLPISRRVLLAAGLLALPGQALAARGQVVTILGDSITAGLGLPATRLAQVVAWVPARQV